MMGLNTAFKKVYGEALAPYGFQKIKGRQPYLVKVVNDEIIYVIGIKNDYSMQQWHKRFDIHFGITTLYRGNLDLTQSVKDNSMWMPPISAVYTAILGDGYDKSIREKMFSFYYEENEQSLIEALDNSFELFSAEILSQINNIDSIKSCVEYFGKVISTDLYIKEDEWVHDKLFEWNYAEGLTNLLIYDSKEFASCAEARALKSLDKLYEDVIAAKSGYLLEDYENHKEMVIDAMNERITIYKEFVSDEEKVKNAHEVMRNRKIINTENLRKLGVKI